MNKKILPFVIILLFMIPLSILAYKSQVLKLSLLPQMVDDVWDFHLTVTPKTEVSSFSFPVPKSGPGLRVSDEKLKQKNLEVYIDSAADSSLVTWISKKPVKQSVQYSARIKIDKHSIEKIKKDNMQSYPASLKEYLRTPVLNEEEDSLVARLEGIIFDPNDDKTTIMRKAYYYVDEEIRRDTKVRTLSETLTIGKGSPLIKARLFNLLMRRKSIPSRIVVLIKFPEDKLSQEKNFRFTFANEVYLNRKWIPMDTNRSHFGIRPDNYLVIHHHYEYIEELISKRNVSYKIVAERARVNKFNKSDFGKEILKSDSWVSKISLYRLPLPLQNMFSTLMLIPLGTLVLCIARNIIGIPTLGIFSPILLTLFFHETSLGFGLAFFMIIIIVGIFERYVLERFYLLAVPRLSVILTLVILMMIIYSLIISDQHNLTAQKHLAFFPIIIVTVIIERLSIMLQEEGAFNTFKTMLGTLVVSVLGFSLYQVSILDMFIFTNPEILLLIMAFLILIGKYKGYRVSEFIRFRHLLKAKKIL